MGYAENRIGRLTSERDKYWYLAKYSSGAEQDRYTAVYGWLMNQLRQENSSADVQLPPANTVHCDPGPAEDYVAHPELGLVHKSSPYAAQFPLFSELRAYNEIYGRSVGTGGVVGTYKSWRKEFEATGSEFAKERMLEAYKPGDEDLDKYPSIAKSERTGISWWRDTPLLWLAVAMLLLAVLAALMSL